MRGSVGERPVPSLADRLAGSNVGMMPWCAVALPSFQAREALGRVRRSINGRRRDRS